MVAVRKKKQPAGRYECPARIEVDRQGNAVMVRVYRTDRDHPYSLAMSFFIDDPTIKSGDMLIVTYGTLRDNLRAMAGQLLGSEGTARKRASKPRRIPRKKRV